MKELISFLMPFLKKRMTKVVFAACLSLPLAAIKAYQASLVKEIFDKGLTNHASQQAALGLAVLLLGLGVLNYPIRFFHFYWIRYVVDSSTCDVRSALYQKFLKLPMSYFQKNKQGELLSSLLNDAHILSEGFKNLVALIREPLTAVFLLGLAIYRDWQLTMVIFVVAPLFAIIFNKSGKKIRRNQEDVQAEIAAMTHNANEGLAGQKIIKAFNLADYAYQRFQKAQNKYFQSLMRTTKIEENAHPLVELVGAIAFSGVILFAHHRIASGELTTGGFISFVTALALLMDPIRKYSQANVKLNQARAAGQRIQEIMNLSEETDEGREQAKTFESLIEVKNLCFKYDDHYVLKNFNMKVRKGQKVALVGLSGSGKSTIISLLLRLYDYTEGEIKIDGKLIEDYSLFEYRRLLGLVSQDIFLFNDTIKENLETGIARSDEEVAKALSIAGASEFVRSMPDEHSTVIGDRGSRLSGGQAQRLTIARAFIQDPDIMLFDEATSALDNESERVVQEALDRIGGEKTVISIAHRLSTIQNYDYIYVLKEGEVVEEGNHSDLIAQDGEYAKLYQLSQR